MRLSEGMATMSDNSVISYKPYHIPPFGRYSKIPILRPPLGLSKSGLKDHFWTVPKVVSNQKYTGCRK